MTRPRTTIAAGAITAGVLAFALARLLLSPASPPAARPVSTVPSITAPAFELANAQPPTASGPERHPADTPSGYVDTEPGAVAAAANFLGLSEAALLDGSGDWSTLVNALAIEPLRSQALAARPAERLFARARAAGPWFARGWRLGYRIDAYAPSAARVGVWTFGIAVGQIPTVSDWSTTTMQLRFTAGGWKIASSHVSPGPTPPPASAPQQAKNAFVSAAARFTAFHDAP